MALAERLAGRLLAAVYTSPRRRAFETALAVAQRQGLLPVVDDLLDEVDYGEWTGRSFDELADDPLWRR